MNQDVFAPHRGVTCPLSRAPLLLSSSQLVFCCRAWLAFPKRKRLKSQASIETSYLIEPDGFSRVTELLIEIPRAKKAGLHTDQ
jgi:hypothetical protein